MVITLLCAMRGVYKEMLCIITMIVGIAASIAGIAVTFIILPPNGAVVFILYMIVLVFSLLIKKMAMHFVTLYENKRREIIERQLELLKRMEDPNERPYYTDETFDDPELRFGKGGYTDNDL